MSLVHRFKPLIKKTVTFAALVTRPMSVGVRAMVLDADGRVFMVKHSYLPGWYLPGGGVEPGETAEEAMARELVEEGGIVAAEARLFGLYLNARVSRRDHVALYVVERFSQGEPPKIPNAEIVAIGFFPVAALPEDTSGATRRRIEEVTAGLKPAPYW